MLVQTIPDYTKLTTESALPAEGEAKEFPCGDKMICVANVNGTCSAMDNVCLHRGGPLGQGMIEGNKVVCPWHAWGFDFRTGLADGDEDLCVQTFPVSVTNGDILIDVP